MKIAIFDSGIGGLTVFNEALRLYPSADYIYFADSHYAPYGKKSEREVERLIYNAADFLAAKNIDVLVLACHTASKLMLNKMRSRYPFPIIGMHSGLIESKTIGNLYAKLICTTDLSMNIWKQYLSKQPINAQFISLQNLVVFAEEKEFDTPDVYSYLNEKFANVDWAQYDSLVLGCTHFPFFKSQLRKIVPDYIKIIDGSLPTALQLNKLMYSNRFQGSGQIEYYISESKRDASFFSCYFDVLKPMDLPLMKVNVKIDKLNYSFMKRPELKKSLAILEDMRPAEYSRSNL